MLKNPNYVYGGRTLQVPANINFGDYMIDKLVSHGDRTALINGATNERITYSEIAQQSMNFAISLANLGVKKGDTIALISENRNDYFGAVVGVACAGAVLTAINITYVKGELLHAMDISKPKYLICSPIAYKLHGETLKTVPFLQKIILFGQERLPNVLMFDDLSLERNKVVKNVKYEEFMSVEVEGQKDILFVMYSSGTTGMPKGVMITHLNVMASCGLATTLNPDDVSLTISPWYHVMGLVGILISLTLGKTVVYLPRFDVELYLKTVEKYKIAQLTVVPPVLVAVLKYKSNHDLSSVKMIYSGAAPLHKETVAEVRDKFPNVESVFQGYGATELTLAVTRYNADDLTPNKTGSVGKIVTNMVIKVVDINTRKPVGPNTPGEICAKGQMLMKGYVGKAKNEDLDDEGFYKTGDIGYYDDDGYFFIVDRLKELIKYKGYQVPPAEVEAVLLQHPSIKEAAVIGIPDKVAGEVPLAFVVLQPEKQLTEQEVKDFVAERLSNAKHLRGGVRFMDQIPKSASGKLLRKDLRKMVATKSHL